MESKIKELIKLCDQLEKLIIRIISLVGLDYDSGQTVPIRNSKGEGESPSPYFKYIKLLSKMQP